MEHTINSAVKAAIESSPDHVKEYHEGKSGLLGLFVGEAIKISKGNLDPKELHEAVKKALENYKQPGSLEEAIEFLIQANKNDLDQLKAMTEKEFTSQAHFALGRNLRNTWFLWWQPNLHKAFPTEKPKLVKYFNEMGITHADDMSAIVLTSFHRKISEKELDVEAQVKHFQDFWKRNGIPDGIPKFKK